MAIAHVQSTGQGFGNSASARSLTFASNVTSGNLIVVAVATFNAGSPTVSISDTQGNTYSQAGSYQTSGSNRISLWYAVAGSTGSNTVSFTPSASVFSGFGIHEYTGTATSTPLDNAVGTTGTASNTVNPGTVTVSAANEMIFCCAGQGDGTNTDNITPGTGYTLRVNQFNSVSFQALYTEDKVSVSANEAPTMSWLVNHNWQGIGASFKIASGATGGPWPWFFDQAHSGGFWDAGL